MLDEHLGRPSLRRILLQTLVNEILKHWTPLVLNGWRLLLDDIVEDARVVFTYVGRFPHGEFDGKNAQRPYVDLVVIGTPPLDQLWCHPAHGAYFGSSCCLLRRQHHSVAKVGKFYLASCGHQNVVRFNVPMDYILTVQVDQGLTRLVQGVLAEVFGIISRKVFEHVRESIIHQFHEDPQTILVVECFIAAHNRLTLAQLHDANLSFDRFTLIRRLWLQKFKGELFAVLKALTQENASETTRALLPDHLVIVAGRVSANVGRSLDQFGDFSAIFQVLLGLVHLSEDSIETGERIL